MEPFNSENIMNSDINLNEEVEFLYGANNEPMLYHKTMKHYIRLSKNGAVVVNYLIKNKSVEKIVEELSIQSSQPRKDVLDTMVKFLTQLREANVLNYHSLQSDNKIYKSILKRPMLSYTFKGNFKNVIHLSNLFMMKLSRKHLAALAILISLLGASYLVMYFYFGGFQRRGTLNIPLLLGLFFLHIAIHETCHIIMMGRFKVNVRGAGLGLLYYFIPIFFVDSTDLYRVKRKFDRAAVAIVGPIFDLFAITLTIGYLTFFSSSVTIEYLLLIQMFFLFANLNLLLPTDGMRFFEALSGEVNVRKRAFNVMINSFNKKNEFFKTNYLTKKKKILYTTYASLSLFYIVLLLFLLITGLRGD